MRTLALALLLAAACSRGRPDVVIVTLDTLRADAMGRGRGTPAVEEFLEEATHFLRARTVVPLTLPSHVSLFTGLFPGRHAIHDNCAPPLPPADRRDFSLLAEEFREAGYATAAFVAAPVLHARTGIAAGFERFEAPDYGPRDATSHRYVPAEQQVDAALEWLRDRREGKPAFLWLHLFDAHFPYTPFQGDARRAPAQPGADARALYAGEVRRIDAALERLLAEVPGDAIVVLVSDHGESLGEHGEPAHDTLCYGATIDAFLAVRARALPRGAEDAGLRSVCDVAPSLRRWCGLPPRPGDGRPLEGPPHDVLVSESLFGWGAHNWGQCFAATDGRFSLVESGPRLELFDRAADFGETRPLPDPERHPAFERLDRALHAWRAVARPGGGGPMAGVISPYGMVRIPFRGYLSRADNAKLADPTQKLSFRRRLDEASDALVLAVWAEDLAAVERCVERIARLAAEEPRNPQPHFAMLKAQAWLGDHGGGRLWARRAAASGLRAMRLGFVDALVLRLTVHAAIGGGDDAALDAALELARASGVTPDDATTAALARVGRPLSPAFLSDSATRH
jgi:arylsulfatase A-like enzyme